MKRCIVGIRHPEEWGRSATGRGQPSIWFPPMSTMAAVLSENSRALLRLIRDQRPKSLTELAAPSGLRVPKAPSSKILRMGDCVKFGLARNPRNNRLDAFKVERGELPEKGVRFIQGQLRRNPKGFAFVDDAFVAPYIVESVAPSVNDVSALAVFGKHPVKGERSWRVIKLNAV